MENASCSLKVGMTVPNFELDTYVPQNQDFGKVSLEGLKNSGTWTVLFLYPADFTFV